jgi:DNA repair protein RadC
MPSSAIASRTDDREDLARRSVEDLLEIVTGRSRASAGPILHEAGGLEALSRADPFEIAAWLDGQNLDIERSVAKRRPGGRTVREAWALAAAFELGRRVEIGRADARPRILSADAVAAWATPRLTELSREELWMLAVDGRGHLRAARCLATGSLHGVSVNRADPLRAALRVDASAFVLVHNHPSGDPTPSREDITFTEEVAIASEIIGVALLDHVVVARSGFACVPVRVSHSSSSRGRSG